MKLDYTPEFTAILEHLHQGRGAFVTGLAGSGKSTLIREFCRTTDRNVVRAATTGIAALLIDGSTVHSLFGISSSTTVHDVVTGKFKPRRRKVLKSMQTLIIDEASMLRADLFDTIVEILNRFGPTPGQWAGGVQLVLVGDLYQLPPVVISYEEEYFRTHYGSPFFFSAHHFSTTRIPTARLTKVFRQIGDPSLVDLLNAVREGLATEHVRQLLATRTIENFEPPTDEFWLTLATSNERARIINERRLNRLSDAPRTSTATITGEVGRREYPNDETIEYAVGAQIMLQTNDSHRRWVNGSVGVVTAINTDGSIEVTLRDSTESVTIGPHTWEIVRPKVKDGRMTNKLVGTFTQLPFKLAWAITIHKSQGQTLDRIAIDLTGGAFAAGQTYVALSRATSLNGIVLTRPVRAKDLKVDPRIIRFLAEPDPFAATAPRCAIAVTTIGETFYADIPRIIEIGIAFSDGTALSTIVNPERDPGTALQDYGISNDDLLLAPTLPAAWAVMSQFLVGRALIAADVDALTQVLTADLKRHGHAISLPIGTDAAVPDSYDL
ncbi:AAA family ATPase [Gordonia aichiensis]|uniref:AAA family ATPase n=1 Tax=Gordonia aichiensis TaxID=36820 RepID=UPI00326587E0